MRWRSCLLVRNKTPRRRASPIPVPIPIPQSLQPNPFDRLAELLRSARAVSLRSGGRETSVEPEGDAAFTEPAVSWTSGGRVTRVVGVTDRPRP